MAQNSAKHPHEYRAMPRIDTVAPDTPFGARLLAGFGYPLRGAALATCVALTLSHYLALLPFIGFFAGFAIWMATWRYAADCLLHTANGYAQPPEVMIEINSAQGWTLALLHVFAWLACVLCAVFMPRLFWPLLLALILLLPAIDMSLAFDGNLAAALNPFNWLQVIGQFGVAYLIPVGINLLLGILLLLGNTLSSALPWLLAVPVSAFIATYLIILGFHLMGALIHQRHEQFGMVAEAHQLAASTGQDADAQLLDQVASMEAGQPDAAIALLVARMQDRHAAAPLHQAYRRLLKRQGLRDGLLEHGHIWMAALMAGGEARRALGVLQECSEIDPGFMPDDPRSAGELAELAERLGMSRLSLRLCEAYLVRWPRDPQAVACGLLAVRLLAGPLNQPQDARALLAKLLAAYGDQPDRRAALDTLSSQLQALPKPA
jgi:hypothetical protein